MAGLEGNPKVNPDKLTFDGKPVKGWIVERIDAAGNVVRKWLELFMPDNHKLPDGHRARPLTYADEAATDKGIAQAKEALARPVAKPAAQAPVGPPVAAKPAPNTNPPAPAARPPVPPGPTKAMTITPAPTPALTPVPEVAAPIGQVGALYLEVSTMEAAKRKTVPISLIRERLAGCTDSRAAALLDTVAAVAKLGYKELDLGSVLRALK